MLSCWLGGLERRFEEQLRVHKLSLVDDLLDRPCLDVPLHASLGYHIRLMCIMVGRKEKGRWGMALMPNHSCKGCCVGEEAALMKHISSN